MSDTPEKIAAKLKTEGQKILEYFQSLAPEQWELDVYTEGASWSVRQVFAHFVASEVSIGRLVDNVLAGGAGAPEDFDLNGYNEKKVSGLEEVTPADLLSQYQAVRQASVEKVARMSAADMARMGRHPFLGMASVEDMLKLIYRHNQIHLRDLRKVFTPDGG